LLKAAGGTGRLNAPVPAAGLPAWAARDAAF